MKSFYFYIFVLSGFSLIITLSYIAIKQGNFNVINYEERCNQIKEYSKLNDISFEWYHFWRDYNLWRVDNITYFDWRCFWLIKWDIVELNEESYNFMIKKIEYNKILQKINSLNIWK